MSHPSAPDTLALAGIGTERFRLPEVRPPFAKPQPPLGHPVLPPGEGPPAARYDDQIAHSRSFLGAMIGLAAGLAVGAVLVAAAVVFAPATLAVAAVAVAVGGGLAATGSAVKKGAELGAKHTGPPCGKLETTACMVLTNDKISAHASLSLAACTKESAPVPIAEGSGSVFINGEGAAREGDKISCGAKIISKCSPDVLIGGGTAQYEDIDGEVPAWLLKGADIAIYAGLAIAIVGAGAMVVGGVIAGAAGGGGVVGGVTGGAVKATELAVWFGLSKGGAKVGEVAFMEGSELFGVEEGSFAHDMSGLVGGEVGGGIVGLGQARLGASPGYNNAPGRAGSFGSRSSNAYNQMINQATSNGGHALRSGARSIGQGTRAAGRTIGNSARATGQAARAGAQRAATQARAAAGVARQRVNRAIVTSYLSARLALAQPKMGPPKPPTPRILQVDAQGRTVSPRSGSGGTGGSGGKSGPPRTDVEYVRGTLSPGGNKTTSASDIIPAKPMRITTHKDNSPALKVGEGNASVKGPKSSTITGATPPKSVTTDDLVLMAKKNDVAGIAAASTRNPDSDTVVLGNWAEGPTSYSAIAEKNGSTYFNLPEGSFPPLQKALGGDDGIWRINEAFMDAQIKAGKSIRFSHDPLDVANTHTATGKIRFFGREVRHLDDNGYKFRKVGDYWEAYR